jgi:hypothetical protein
MGMSHLHGRRRLAASLPVLLICVALAGCGTTATNAPSTPVPAVSAAPTVVAVASPSGAPSATPAASVADLAWALVDLPDSSDVGMIADVVALPGTVVVVAAGGAAGEHGIAWSSSDAGATWASERLPGNTHGVGRSVAWGDRVLALGEGDGDCAHPAVTKIWLRDAAGSWKAAPFDPLMCAGGIAQAATAGEHAVILGTGAGDVGFAWSSGDGLKWTDQSSTFEGRMPQGVAADGSGFVAFGVGPFPGPAWSARSADGSTWEKPVPLPGLADGSIIGNPVVLDGEIAVFVGDPSGAIGVLKPDGSGGWKSELTSGLTRATLSRIVAVGDGLVALGGGDAGPLAWTSADGVTWQPLDLPVEATESGIDSALNGAAIVDGRAYLVGQRRREDGGTSGGAVGALWSGPAELLQP